MSQHFAIVTEFEGFEIEIDALGIPVKVRDGVRCGHCAAKHSIARAVKLCKIAQETLDAEAEAEMHAEAAVERYFEDRGYWDARAQEDYEAAHGVIPFDVAYREALGMSTEDFDAPAY